MNFSIEQLKDRYGEAYSECVSARGLDFLVAHGISSGLKAEGFSSEQIIANALESGLPDQCSKANLIVNLQIRDLLARFAFSLDKLEDVAVQLNIMMEGTGGILTRVI